MDINKEITKLIGEYGWLILSGFLIIIFKNTIENIFYGLRFFFGNDYNPDDIVYIHGKKCRIIRQNIFRTTFYIISENKKFHISNDRLEDYIIEKELK